MNLIRKSNMYHMIITMDISRHITFATEPRHLKTTVRHQETAENWRGGGECGCGEGKYSADTGWYRHGIIVKLDHSP
jgi:hypothetical protein